LEVEIAVEKLKRDKSPSSDQIPAEMIQAGGEILHFKVHKLINYTEWSRSGRTPLIFDPIAVMVECLI
jgi:hypothetical protein